MGRDAIEPNLENCNESELKAAMAGAASVRTYRQLEVIFMFSRGFSRELITQGTGMLERTIRRICLLFNRRGIDGLIEKKHRGRPRKLAPNECKDLVEKFQKQRPEQYFWSVRKFHGILKENKELDISYSTVRRIIIEQGLSLQVPRPWPAEQDEEKRVIFREKFKELYSNPDIEVWFLDETGIEGNPRPRKAWYPKGSRPKHLRQSEHIRTNICGMVAPRSGEFFAIELPYSDTITFQCFLDEANKTITPSRKRSVIIMDNASWHKVSTLRWGKFEPVYLPPYSPDLNPIERLWLVLKANFFSGFLADSVEALSNRVFAALLHFIAAQSELISLCKPTI